LKRLRTWRTCRIGVERPLFHPRNDPGNDEAYTERHRAISPRLLATRCFRAPPALDVTGRYRTVPELITGASCLTVNGTRLLFWKGTSCPPSASRRPAAFRPKVGQRRSSNDPMHDLTAQDGFRSRFLENERFPLAAADVSRVFAQSTKRSRFWKPADLPTFSPRMNTVERVTRAALFGLAHSPSEDQRYMINGRHEIYV